MDADMFRRAGRRCQSMISPLLLSLCSRIKVVLSTSCLPLLPCPNSKLPRRADHRLEASRNGEVHTRPPRAPIHATSSCPYPHLPTAGFSSNRTQYLGLKGVVSSANVRVVEVVGSCEYMDLGILEEPTSWKTRRTTDKCCLATYVVCCLQYISSLPTCIREEPAHSA